MDAVSSFFGTAPIVIFLPARTLPWFAGDGTQRPRAPPTFSRETMIIDTGRPQMGCLPISWGKQRLEADLNDLELMEPWKQP